MSSYPEGARAPQFPAVECVKITDPANFKTIEAGHCDENHYPVIDRISNETVKRMPAGARHYVRVISGVMAIHITEGDISTCKHVLLDDLGDGWYMAQIVYSGG
jgi:hypothetical protein